MGRTSREKPRGRAPGPPAEQIELNDQHFGRRLLFTLVFLALGVGMLAYAVVGLTAPKLGWQEIQVNPSAGTTCGDDFSLLYQVRSRTESREVTDLYSRACRKAFQLFHSDQEFEDAVNICTINRHPNQALEVDGGLYKALSVFAASGRRELYLGPVYERYDDLFFCQDDAQAVDFDPRLNADVAAEYAGILAYANDPQAIGLELLDGNRVRLRVSEAYLAKAEREGITKLIDFSWMRCAFIADYIAEELTAGGYTAGVLNSFNGFTRNLDGRGVEYTYPLLARWGDTIYPPADLCYKDAMSLVRMRDYPASALDLQQYYTLDNGEIRTLYLDTADALCRSSIDTLTCFSLEKGCAQVLLEMIPVYIAEDFREESVLALAEKGTQSVYCQENVIRYTDPEMVLRNFFDRDGVRYTAEPVPPS